MSQRENKNNPDNDCVEKPNYLSIDFLQDICENAFRESNLTVNNIKFALGSGTGENFCSKIYRVKMQVSGFKLLNKYIKKEFSIIVKCMPATDATQFVQDLKMFLKEKITYNEILPRMEMILENGDRFGPRIYHWMKEPVNTLVFEDLNTENFTTASRESGFDLIHSKMVIRRLAQFHAASMILARRDNRLFETLYTDGLLAPAGLTENGMMLRFFEANIKALYATVQKWQGYESIVIKLGTYIKNFREELIKSQSPRPYELKVLNHGDMWVNNILFKYDDNTCPAEVIFIDYQLSVWGSPGIDLNYFFYTSLNLEVLRHKRDELIVEYHNTLCSQLQKYHFQHIPSYKEIRDEVRNREAYGFFANFAIYPLISMDKELSSDASVENLADDEFARKKMERIFTSKQLQETLRYTLKRFEQIGIWQ